jgi:hypothetical protein
MGVEEARYSDALYYLSEPLLPFDVVKMVRYVGDAKLNYCI